MNAHLGLLLVGLAALTFGCSVANAAEKLPSKTPAVLSPKGPEGLWQGTIKAGSKDLRIVVHISKKPDGTLNGTLDSLDQGTRGLRIQEVTWKEGKFHFELKGAKASYEGKVSADESEIGGDWKQGGKSYPLTFKRIDKIVDVPRRSQEPKKPYPYAEEEVRYENKRAGITLAGTLTFPRGKGPFPAALLITGSGPQDRDETILNHKPFLILADYLTRRGIAVLRVDDRGVGGSTGNTMQSTTEDFAGDVLCGIAYLKSRKEIDPHRIGLIGHSEGGIIAPMVAARSTDVAFIVMMAGTGLPGADVIHLQKAAALRAEGVSEEKIAKDQELQTRIFAVIRTEKDQAVAKRRLRELMREEERLLIGDDDKKQTAAKMASVETKPMPETKPTPGMTKAGEAKNDKGTPPASNSAPQPKKEKLDPEMETEIGLVDSPWFRFFLDLDPRPALRKVHCPVLAINGSKDVQVVPRENTTEIAKALKEAGNEDVTIKVLPNLNHLFQTCKTGDPSEYAQIEETLSPTVLKLIGDWIVKGTSPAEPAAAK